MTLTRRQALSTLAMGGVGLAAAPRVSLAQAPAAAATPTTSSSGR